MKHTPRQYAKNYLYIVLASVVYALAFDWCFDPNGIAFGGITGVAQIINRFIPALPIGGMVFVFNLPLFLLGWKLLGGHLLLSSLAAMSATSFFIDSLALIYTFPPMDPMLAAIFGGVLLGLALGVIFQQGATTGGTDLIARLLKLKLAWLPVGKILLFIDLAVIVCVALAFRSLNSALYGIIGLYISTIVMDGVLYGLDKSKVAYIISDAHEEITRYITHNMERGVTIIHATGAWSGEEKQVLMVAFNQREIVQIKQAVYEADPNAFLIVCDAHDVLGEGFRTYRKDDI